MASEKDKERQRQRFARQTKHLIGREEEQRRKRNSKSRRASRRGGSRKARTGWDEDDETFEKIRRMRNAEPCRAKAGPEVPDDLPRATVAAVHHGRVELDSGETARIAGRLLVDPGFRLAVGDVVMFSETDGPPRIEALVPRRSRIARPDPGRPERELVLAANVDVAVIVAAVVEPPLRPGLVDRFLLALERGGVAPAVCANKVDLLPGGAADASLDSVLQPYEDLGVPVYRCSAATGAGLADLRAGLEGRTCVFVGHSGVGKSSLLNALDPEGHRPVGAVRAADGKGRHTTSHSSLRPLGGGTRLIDTPGIRAFGLDALDPAAVCAGFPELGSYAGGCRFADCTHAREPDCAVRAAVEAGRLPAARYASYLRILASLE